MHSDIPRPTARPTATGTVAFSAEYGKYRYEEGDCIGGRFYVHARAAGGCGQVYLCYDQLRDYFYALKTLKMSQETLDDPRTVPLFQREVSTWIALGNHPHIVRCFTLEILDGLPFIVLEWVADTAHLCQLYRHQHGDAPLFLDWYARLGQRGLDLRRYQSEANRESAGTTLGNWIDRYGRLAPPFAVQLILDLCAALSHSQSIHPGFVHRDIKPANILLDEQRRAKLSDFGTANLVRELLVPGAITGTPGYMAPEQARGEELDVRADIYAIGCVLYEMLTGRPSFDEISKHTKLHQGQQRQPPPLALPSFVPTAFNEIVQTCLQHNPDARFASLAELVNALSALVSRESVRSRERHTSLTPATVEERNQVAVVYYNLAQYELALAEIERAIALDSSYPNSYTNRGCIYHVQGQVDAALADYAKAIRLGRMSINAKARNNRGLLYLSRQQPQRALRDLAEAIEAEAEYANAYVNLGLAHTQMGNLEEALAAYDRALEIAPKHVPGYHNRGYVYEQLGNLEQALSDYSAALARDPTFVQAYINRSLLYARLGQFDKVERDRAQIARLNPKDKFDLDSLESSVWLSQPDPQFLNMNSLEDMVSRPLVEQEVQRQRWAETFGLVEKPADRLPLHANGTIKEVVYAETLHASVQARQQQGLRITQVVAHIKVMQADGEHFPFDDLQSWNLLIDEEAMRMMAAQGLKSIYDLKNHWIFLRNDDPSDIHRPLRIISVA